MHIEIYQLTAKGYPGGPEGTAWAEANGIPVNTVPSFTNVVIDRDCMTATFVQFQLSKDDKRILADPEKGGFAREIVCVPITSAPDVFGLTAR